MEPGPLAARGSTAPGERRLVESDYQRTRDEGLPVVVFAYDVEGRVTLSEGSGLERMGLRAGELVGHRIRDLYGEDSESERLVRRTLAGESFYVDAALPGMSLTTRYQPLRDGEGTITGGLGITVDVTAIAAAEEERRRQVQRATALADLAQAWQDGTDPVPLLERAARTVAETTGAWGVMVRITAEDVADAPVAAHHVDPAVGDALVRAMVEVDDDAMALLAALTPADGVNDDMPDPATDVHPDDRIGAWRQRIWDVGARRRLRLVLRGRHGPIGLLMVLGDQPGTYSEEERRLAVEVAERVALVLDNGLLLRRLQSTAAHRAELLEAIVDAQESERARVSDDIHDDTVQVLAALDLRLGLLRRRLEGDVAATAQVDRCLDDLRAAAGRLRDLMFDLDVPASRLPLVDALQQVADHVLGPAGLDWVVREVVAPGASRVRAVGRTADLVAYRLAQEALVNAVKHAEASRVEVVLDERDDHLVLTVEDDGRGIPAGGPVQRPGHRGTQAMRERAGAAGGQVRWARGARGGTLVVCELPVER